jgi:aminoglycoside phosphotransferase (APT) family kinase protein
MVLFLDLGTLENLIAISRKALLFRHPFPTGVTGRFADCALASPGDLAEIWLREIDARDGPVAGADNFHRGVSLSVYDAETRWLTRSHVWSVTQIWVPHGRERRWIHGDVAEGNVLANNGRLCAVIDLRCAGVGDPSCDLTIAWTFLDPAGRAVFEKQ